MNCSLGKRSMRSQESKRRGLNVLRGNVVGYVNYTRGRVIRKDDAFHRRDEIVCITEISKQRDQSRLPAQLVRAEVITRRPDSFEPRLRVFVCRDFFAAPVFTFLPEALFTGYECRSRCES